MENDDYKYIMVAAYRCPKEYLSEKALVDLDKDLYVPDEPTEAEEDDPMELQADPHAKDLPFEVDDSEEEKDKEPAGPETLDEAVEGLARQEEWATVYITRPLRGRTNHYVVQAAKEILLQLKQSGLHVGVVHTDRAREFKAKAFREWVVDAKLRHTRTAGGDPAGNSSAELGIKWAKARVRALLMASGASAKDWPMAIQHASSQLWSRAFPDSPWHNPPATAFGSEVWFRSKVYQGKKEKKHDAASMRWKKGWYRGPAADVKRGHLIVREDGGLTVAKSVKFDVFEPEKELKDFISPAIATGLPEETTTAAKPMTKAELRDEVEFCSRKLFEEKNFGLEKVAALYQLLEQLGDTDMRTIKKSKVTSWYTGAFVQGGVAGLRSNVKEFPWTTRFLVAAAKHYCGEVKFSALGLAKNAQLGLHRDSHNYAGSRNYVLPLQNFENGSLWVQEDDVTDEECVEKALPNGKLLRGKCLEMVTGQAVSFSPRAWHEVQPWSGERLVLLLYTPRATKLHPSGVESLQELGFNVDLQSLVPTDDDSDEEEKFADESFIEHVPQVKSLRGQPQADSSTMAFVEIEDDDLFPEGSCKLPHIPQPHRQEFLSNQEVTGQLKKMVKKAEVQYTHNIEAKYYRSTRPQRSPWKSPIRSALVR